MNRVSNLKKVREQLGIKQLIAASVWLSILTVGFRLWQLDQLPPGLHLIEAQNGLDALAGRLAPSIKEAQQALSIALIAFGQKITSNSVIGVRIGPILAGIASVFFFYRWLTRVYGRRVAQIGTMFFAVLPWPLYLTRFGSGYSLSLLFITSSLYLLATSWQRRGTRRSVLTIVVLAAGLYTHPSYNWFILAVLLAGAVNLKGIVSLRRNMPTRMLIGSLVFLLTAAAAAPSVIAYFAGILPNLSSADGLLQAVQMFNIKGPVDYGFNLSNLPLLNAFVGLMLLLGLLCSVTGLRRRANRTVLIMFFIGLLAFLIHPLNAPLADKTLILLVPALTLAAIGADYLLSQWLKTFPQNSAARNVGSVMMLILLFFTLRHSHNQYFLAWRASSETKTEFNTQTLEAVKFASSQKFNGERFIVGSEDDLTVARYVIKGDPAKLILPSQIKKIKKDKQPEQYLILESTKTDAIKALAKTFPGGKLAPKLSGQQELFLIYTVK